MIGPAILFISFGTLYIIKPDVYRGGIYERTAIMPKLLSQKRYTVYMRCLGVAFIILGIGFLFYHPHK